MREEKTNAQEKKTNYKIIPTPYPPTHTLIWINPREEQLEPKL